MESKSDFKTSQKALLEKTCVKQRKMVTDAMNKMQYSTAKFHASILVSMSNKGSI